MCQSGRACGRNPSLGSPIKPEHQIGYGCANVSTPPELEKGKVVENAASIRSQAVVAAFDATDHVAEHGFTIANAEALEAARGLCKGITDDAIHAIDRHFGEMKAMGQNPYRDRCRLDGQDLRFVTVVEISASDAMAQRFDRAFSESTGLPRPKLPIFMSKVESEIRKALQAHGFELAACEHHDDGTLARVAVRDPVYAVEAANVRGLPPAQDLEAGLQRLRTLPSSSAKADLGIQSLKSAEKLPEVLAFVDEMAVRAVETTRAHLQAMITAGLSPFTTDSGWHRPGRCFVVDQSRVFEHSDNDVRALKSATVVIERNDAIMNRFERTFGDDVTVRSENFLQYVAVAVGQRLMQHPELRAALVAPAKENFNGVEAVALTVFCVDDPPPSAAAAQGRAFLRHLLDRLLMRSSRQAPAPPALPAPERQPQALLIPPVELPRRESAEVPSGPGTSTLAGAGQQQG